MTIRDNKVTFRVVLAGALGAAFFSTWSKAAEPNDPRIGDQWHLQPHREVVVALIDSGMNMAHEDLALNLWINSGEIPGNGVDDDLNGYVDDVNGWDFVDVDGDPSDACYGHGTTTAGVLGAVRDNGIGVAGAAKDVRLMVLRVLDCGGTGTEQWLVDAVNYARDNGADLIQAVVFVSGAWGISCWQDAGCVPNFCQAIGDSELLFVSPSGNEGLNIDPPLYRYPPSCGHSNQITVTASNEDDELASFASVGAQTVHLAAPGVGIWTTAPTTGSPLLSDPSGYRALDGASVATPQVAALAARLLQLDPRLDAVTLRNLVLEHVELSPAYAQTVTGGRLSAFWTFSSAPPPPPPPPPAEPGLVLHVKLEGGSGADASGSGNDLTCSACPSSAAGLAGDGGTAGNFSNDWLERTHSALRGALPSAGASEFTIAAWIDLDTTSDRQPIASKQGNGERGFMFLASHYIGGRLRFETWPTGASSPVLVDGTTPLGGAPHHVAVTRDVDGIVRLYVDGTLENSAVAGPPRTNAQPLDVGRYRWSGSYQRFFDGVIDDVRFYDRALSGAELSDLVQGPTP